MIHNFAEILQEFIKEEQKKLKAYELKHAPTIGDMYEGLSTGIINRVIPEGLSLKVVEGFIVDAHGRMSGQIDCMLVRGDGEIIPHTKSYKWPIWDVLVVFEVKKNIYGRELSDSFIHLRDVAQAFREWLHGATHKELKAYNIKSSLTAFSRITGVHAPEFKDKGSLPPELELIYYTLVIEQLAPIRIVLGYDGYKTEKSLRDGFVDFLENQQSGSGFGVLSFPHLIICNEFSLVKSVGQPYMHTMEDNHWDFFVSSKTNPIWIMIELIWAKIETTFGISLPGADDLAEEIFHKFIAAKPIVENGKSKGWFFRWNKSPEKEDSEEKTVRSWAPKEVNEAQFFIFNFFTQVNEIDISGEEFMDYMSKQRLDVRTFIQDLQRTGLVALDGKFLRLAVERLMCAIMPDGKFLVGEDSTGRMSNYINSVLPSEPK